MKPTIFVAMLVLIAMLTGCASGALFYTWKCPDGTCAALASDDRACAVTMNQNYSPVIAGPGPLATIYKDCMEKKGYVKIADRLPVTVEPGVGGSGVNLNDPGFAARLSPAPTPIDTRLVRQRLVSYLRDKRDTTTLADMQPINAVCTPEAANSYPLFAATKTQIRDHQLRARVKCQMVHGVVFADRGSGRVLDLDEAVDYILLRRGPDSESTNIAK
jgi:hypothetical protein